ncbi:MAG: cysteine desulfurase family protein, partial [Candidatus Baltobacteraceae bacterium]
TILASVMYANNEIGVVQPVSELAEIAHRHRVLFHTDAVQAPGWLPVNVPELGVDLLSLSAHKFYGPKGVGMLYARSDVALPAMIQGGGQEFGRRSGTENLAGIVGFAAALDRAVTERPARASRVSALRERLENGLLERIADVRINGAGAPRLPNSCNVSFAGVDSESVLMRLDLEGVAVSAGSACTSGATEPSHVIAALGIEPRWHEGVIRFSLGAATTEDEIEFVLALVTRVIAGLRGNTVGARMART